MSVNSRPKGREGNAYVLGGFCSDSRSVQNLAERHTPLLRAHSDCAVLPIALVSAIFCLRL